MQLQYLQSAHRYVETVSDVASLCIEASFVMQLS